MCWRGASPICSRPVFCIEALEEALGQGRPEIFNTDQGSQFTDHGFTSLLRAHGVAISMDGRGRFADNSAPRAQRAEEGPMCVTA